MVCMMALDKKRTQHKAVFFQVCSPSNPDGQVAGPADRSHGSGNAFDGPADAAGGGRVDGSAGPVVGPSS